MAVGYCENSMADVKSVRFIEWGQIPREQHLSILGLVRVGESVYRLPPYMPTNGHISWKIPISTTEIIVICNTILKAEPRPAILSPNYNYLEYRAKRTVDEYGFPDVVWERVA